MTYTTLNPAALESLFTSPTGPVMRQVALTAEAIRDIAAGFVNSKTGTLAASGEVRPLPGHMEVAFTADYAAAVELGAQPHLIVARNARALAFSWPKAGGQVFFRSVSHPGNAAQHYLLRAAAAVAAAPLI